MIVAFNESILAHGVRKLEDDGDRLEPDAPYKKRKARISQVSIFYQNRKSSRRPSSVSRQPFMTFDIVVCNSLSL
jgi:hypothetical protein